MLLRRSLALWRLRCAAQVVDNLLHSYLILVDAHALDPVPAQKGGHRSWAAEQADQGVDGGVPALGYGGVQELPHGEAHLLTMKVVSNGGHGRTLLHLRAGDRNLLIKRKCAGIHPGKRGRRDGRFERAHQGVGLAGVHPPVRARAEIEHRQAARAGARACGQRIKAHLQCIRCWCGVGRGCPKRDGD